MTNKYYYLVASLPFLKFGDAPPLSRDDFVYECEKWLTSEDIGTLLAADRMGKYSGKADGAILGEWKDFDGELRSELARFRAARKGGEEYRGSVVTKSILEQGTPLLMEKEFEKIRWEFIDDRAKNYFFDANRIVLYYLQLQILERLATFNKDKGESFFYKLCEVSYEQENR